jgi:hypothetical protein
MSGRRGRFGRPGRGLVPLLLAVVVAIAVGVTFLIRDQTASPKPVLAGDLVASAITNHAFLPPECAPVHARRWVYPGTVTMSSTLYESFAISYPCTKAASWTKRLARVALPYSKTGNLIPLHGPAGYSCGAWADATGHAYAGGCQRGSSAFGWNWNVANPHDYFNAGSNGRLELSKGGGTDAESLLHTLGANRYELDIANTSGIGYIDRFLWSPPPGWTITALTKTTGGSCKLVSAGISCTGTLRPPTCLCAGAGGAVVVDFTIDATSGLTSGGKARTFGSEGSGLELKSMTPVPFLVPGTPQAAARQRGE